MSDYVMAYARTFLSQVQDQASFELDPGYPHATYRYLNWPLGVINIGTSFLAPFQDYI